MAAELTIKDWTADNLANTNFVNPYVVAKLDTTNSTAVATGVQLAAVAADTPIGIVYETTKLDPTGAVIKNTGVVIRSWGIARITVNAATAVAAMLNVAAATGFVATQARNAAWQNVPVVGIGLTSTTALNDRVLAMLTTGQIV
jgi:hypothetical protein